MNSWLGLTDGLARDHALRAREKSLMFSPKSSIKNSLARVAPEKRASTRLPSAPLDTRGILVTEYYTYIWRDADGVPFYVGKGKGRRAYDVASGRRSQDFLRIHSAGGCTVEIIDWFIHESQAHAHEVQLIEMHGRREMGGLLINRTDGGEGASGSTHTDSARVAISETNRRVYESDPSRRARVTAGNLRRFSDPAARAKQSAALSGLPKSSDHKAKLSRAHSGKKLTAEHRRKIGDAFRGLRLTDEHRDKVSTSARFRQPVGRFKGVSLHKASSKWQASIKVDGKLRYLGTYETPELAAHRYDAAAIEAWGVGNCYLNFPNSVTDEVTFSDSRRHQVRADSKS